MNCFQNANFSEDSQVSNPVAYRVGVVNCFQNANFSEDSQEMLILNARPLCCELLSEC